MPAFDMPPGFTKWNQTYLNIASCRKSKMSGPWNLQTQVDTHWLINKKKTTSPPYPRSPSPNHQTPWAKRLRRLHGRSSMLNVEESKVFHPGKDGKETSAISTSSTMLDLLKLADFLPSSLICYCWYTCPLLRKGTHQEGRWTASRTWKCKIAVLWKGSIIYH